MKKQSVAILAFDFSMNKPAMCAYVNNNLYFYVWPSAVDAKTESLLKEANIKVYNRNLPPMKHKEYNEHTLIVEHVTRANNLANMIYASIDELLTSQCIDIENVIIANEGLAFGAKGDAALDLSGYKYILMNLLISKGFKNFKTYTPTTIKSTADCSKRGMTKLDMIEKFGEQEDKHSLITIIKHSPESLKKQTNYVKCVDDLVDAYWCFRTVLKKENIVIE